VRPSAQHESAAARAGSEAEVSASDLAGGPTPDYRPIAERNLFRPLVVAPKSGGGEAAAGGAAAKGGPASAPKGGAPTPGGAAKGGPPPDPTADLALTGIIETTDGLRALIEKLSTRQGDFVAVGDQVFGFTLKAIAAGSVTLAQGSRTHELKLGAKEIASAAAPAAPAPPTPGPPAPGAGPPGGQMPPGMPDFRSMSPDQRRAGYGGWWNNLTEEQKADFRCRREGWRSRGR
jgi:hypothetical protein